MLHFHKHSCAFVPKNKTEKQAAFSSLAWNQSKYVLLFSATYCNAYRTNHLSMVLLIPNRDKKPIAPYPPALQWLFLSESAAVGDTWVKSARLPWACVLLLFVMMGLIVGIEQWRG